MKRLISWEKFSNPFRHKEDGIPPKKEKLDEDDLPEYEEVSNKVSMSDLVIENPQTLEYDMLGRQYNLWILNTNFDIDSDEELDKIYRIDGVEFVEPISRYRVRIAVGKLFCDSAVREKIGEVILESGIPNIELDSDTAQKVSVALSLLKGTYEHWAIFVLPNGEMDIVKEEKIMTPEFLETVELYQAAKKHVTGYLVTSESNHN